MVSKSKEFREKIAAAFISALEEKELDWKKGWKGATLAPKNAIRNHNYKGINAFYLLIVSMVRGYSDPRWATFNQIKAQGWTLEDAKGKGVQVEYWFPYDKEEKKAITWQEFRNRGEDFGERYILHARYSTVFNASHIKGIPELVLPPGKDINVDELIPKLSENMGVEIINDGGDRAFYRKSEDKIHLPLVSSFDSDYEYNTTALHELAHATGAEHRLNRNLANFFGSEDYAFEELIAEITSCFMSFNLNTEQNQFHLNNHKAYVQSWISVLKEKPEALSKAIAEAEKAASYMEMKAGLIPEESFKIIEASTLDLTEDKIQQETLDTDVVLERMMYREAYDRPGMLKANEKVTILDPDMVPEERWVELERKLVTGVEKPYETVFYYDSLNENYVIATEGYNNLEFPDTIFFETYSKEGAETEFELFNGWDQYGNARTIFSEPVHIEKQHEPKTISIQFQEKIQAEYDKFINDLKKLSPAEIIDRAYEKVFKLEFLNALLDKSLDTKEITQLLQMDNVLDTIYNSWLQNDYSYMDIVYGTVDETIKDMLSRIENMNIQTEPMTSLNSPSAYKVERLEKELSVGDVVRNLNGTDYEVVEILTEKDLLLRNTKSQMYNIGLNTNFFVKYPSDENHSSKKREFGIEWGSGDYLSNNLSESDLSLIRREYGDGLIRQKTTLSAGFLPYKELLLEEAPLDSEHIESSISVSNSREFIIEMSELRKQIKDLNAAIQSIQEKYNSITRDVFVNFDNDNFDILSEENTVSLLEVSPEIEEIPLQKVKM